MGVDDRISKQRDLRMDTSTERGPGGPMGLSRLSCPQERFEKRSRVDMKDERKLLTRRQWVPLRVNDMHPQGTILN